MLYSIKISLQDLSTLKASDSSSSLVSSANVLGMHTTPVSRSLIKTLKRIFVVHFSRTWGYGAYISSLPHHLPLSWCFRSLQGWQAPSTECLYSAIHEPAEPAAHFVCKGAAHRRHSDFQVLSSPSGHQAGAQHLQKSAICEAGKLKEWALWAWTLPQIFCSVWNGSS